MKLIIAVVLTFSFAAWGQTEPRAGTACSTTTAICIKADLGPQYPATKLPSTQIYDANGKPIAFPRNRLPRCETPEQSDCWEMPPDTALIDTREIIYPHGRCTSSDLYCLSWQDGKQYYQISSDPCEQPHPQGECPTDFGWKGERESAWGTSNLPTTEPERFEIVDGPGCWITIWHPEDWEHPEKIIVKHCGEHPWHDWIGLERPAVCVGCDCHGNIRESQLWNHRGIHSPEEGCHMSDSKCMQSLEF